MRSSPVNSTRVEDFYRLALYLYPVRFRERNQEAMMQSLRDALFDCDLPRPALLQTLVKDLLESIIKENFAMLRETISRPILLYNALVLLALFTVLSLGFVVIEQQALRQSANDPQLGMAADLAGRLAHGATPASAISSDQIDMDASPSAFVIAYNEQGQVLASSAQLNETVPALPRGVLEFARIHGEERVTWAPRRDVRIASVVRHVAGPEGGFVLAGRNLREIEARKDLIFQMAALVWLGLIGIIFVGTFLLGWLTRTPSPVAA
jgi:hypothetical protein